MKRLNKVHVCDDGWTLLIIFELILDVNKGIKLSIISNLIEGNNLSKITSVFHSAFVMNLI